VNEKTPQQLLEEARSIQQIEPHRALDLLYQAERIAYTARDYDTAAECRKAIRAITKQTF